MQQIIKIKIKGQNYAAENKNKNKRANWFLFQYAYIVLTSNIAKTFPFVFHSDIGDNKTV